ncbi:hypothetical protein AtNW77_MTg0322251 (mitochondrion) [Arabidopsis thaliana]
MHLERSVQSQLTESKEIARPYSLWGISLAQHSFKTSTRSTGKKRSKGSTSQDGKKQESLESRNDLGPTIVGLIRKILSYSSKKEFSNLTGLESVKLGNEADRSQSKKGSPIGSGIAYLSFLLQYALGREKSAKAIEQSRSGLDADEGEGESFHLKTEYPCSHLLENPLRDSIVDNS